MEPQQPLIYRYTLQHALASKLLIVVAVGGLLLGVIFGLLGVMLVYIGATANTQITLFGQTLSSGSVGVASLFIAAMTVLTISRRVLKSFDDLMTHSMKE